MNFKQFLRPECAISKDYPIVEIIKGTAKSNYILKENITEHQICSKKIITSIIIVYMYVV